MAVALVSSALGSLDSPTLIEFSTLFTYPGDDYVAAAQRCIEGLDGMAKENFETFLAFVSSHSLDELQASYTEIFELNFHIAPYAGYHLFGESYLRSSFLVELTSRFNKHGFRVHGELPDHLSVLLKFIAEFPETKLAEELVESAIVPMLQRIVWSQVRPEDRPENISAGLAYFSLISSLLNYLSKSDQKESLISLPVHSSPVADNSGIDQWIRRKKKEV